MNDQEIRMWAVEQVMNEYREVDAAIDEAQRLYLYVTGQGDKQTHSNAAATPDLMAAGYSVKYRASI